MAYPKLSKKEIKNLLLKIPVDKGEKFKQIIFDNEFSPYIISSYGKIYSINYMHKLNNITRLKTTIDKDGYELIIINYNRKHYGFHIHRLLAIHFIKNPDPSTYTQVNHINGDKLCNNKWNLEWVTPKENISHAWDTGLSHSVGENNGRSKFTISQIQDVCKLLEKGVPIKKIHKITGVSSPMIYLILQKKNWIIVSKDYNFDNYYSR